MTRRTAVAAAALIAVAATACGPTPSTVPSARASAESTDGSAATLCPGVPLGGPDGNQVDLTGTWRGFASGLLFVTQTGSCVGIEGLSNNPDEPLGTQWRSVFTGDLTGEFTIVGRWMWTYGLGLGVATGDTHALTMPIEFDDQSQPVIQIAPEDVGYVYPAEPGAPETLERISSSTTYPD